MNSKQKARSFFIQALKVAIGSSLAIYIATVLKLQFAASAGIITLLSILTTKWDTVRISLNRILSFALTLLLTIVIFHIMNSPWLEFGVFIFLLVFISEFIGWKATISVNAVVGTHFMATLDFSFAAIMNELLLVVIGVVIAIIVNLFQNNGNAHKKLIQNMRYTEEKLQYIMNELVMYMKMEKMDHSVWSDIEILEEELARFVDDAYKYQNNTFRSHPGYYIQYFQMRTQQCNVLHNLHDQMKRLRYIPKQAEIIADYIAYMKNYIVEINHPSEQMKRLGEIFAHMRTEPLPEDREEFENRAILYHILLDLEEFLLFKGRFVESLEEKQKDIYWKNPTS